MLQAIDVDNEEAMRRSLTDWVTNQFDVCCQLGTTCIFTTFAECPHQRNIDPIAPQIRHIRSTASETLPVIGALLFDPAEKLAPTMPEAQASSDEGLEESTAASTAVGESTAAAPPTSTTTGLKPNEMDSNTAAALAALSAAFQAAQRAAIAAGGSGV